MSAAPQVIVPARDLLGQFLAHVDDVAMSLEGRRDWPLRRQVSGPVTLGTLAADGSYQMQHRAWASDVSDLGVGLLTEAELPAGLILAVDFSAFVERACLVPARVIYCQQCLTHTYRVGAMFLDVGQ